MRRRSLLKGHSNQTTHGLIENIPQETTRGELNCGRRIELQVRLSEVMDLDDCIECNEAW